MRNPRASVIYCLVGPLVWGSGCGITGTTCGGLSALLCGEGMYCRYEGGSCGTNGVCAERPDVCTEIFAPVCGCDGHTYGNECEAAVAGISVQSEGACPGEGPSLCGGLAGFACAAGEFCKFTTGTCGTGDQTGLCLPIPGVCTAVLDPVCGCDGVTYDSSCAAQRAGISIDHQGACQR